MSLTADSERPPSPDHDALVVQRCVKCGHVPNFPRVACPRCFGEMELRTIPGIGQVQTYAIVQRTHDDRFVARLPIMLALIKLEEGRELISTIVGEDRLSTTVGSAVVVAPPALNWSSLRQFVLTAPDQPK